MLCALCLHLSCALLALHEIRVLFLLQVSWFFSGIPWIKKKDIRRKTSKALEEYRVLN